MDIKAIQSKINLIKSELLQLADRNSFTEHQEQLKQPQMQAKLDALELELKAAINNLDITI